MIQRFACVRQSDQSDCGAAVLAIVARHYRMSVPLQRLRDLAGTDRVGTNLLGLVEAAEQLGFAARAVKGPPEALGQIPLPAIAHVRTSEGLGHFVVLHKVTSRHVIVADPARGIERLPRDEFAAQWTGYLMLLSPEAAVRIPPGGNAVPSPCRRFLGILSCHRGVLAEAAVCALCMTLLGISTSYFIQHLVDSVLVRGETQLLNALGIGMLAILMFKTLFGVVRHYLLAHVGRQIDLSLISSYARHILTLPLSFFEMRRVGEILSRVNDAAKIREAVGGATLTAVVDGLLVVITGAVLWCYDMPLAMAATAFTPVLLVTVLLHHPIARRRSREAMEHGALLSAHLIEDISGVETLKAHGARRLRNEAGEDRLLSLVRSVYSLQMINLSVSTASGIITGLAGLAILWFGGHRVIAGALSIGELMFFYTLLGCMLEPLVRLASVNHQIQDALVAVDRLYQILDLEAERNPADKKARLGGVSRAIELRGVSFRYGCRDDVLKEVDLSIPAGSTVALVGESGCGKSTLLKLLMRFYDPTGGQVLIDGVDMRDFDVEGLRRRIGFVSQDAFIFNGSVRDNIALGNPQAPLEEVIAVARAAGLDEFIARLPQRYDTIIGERGANLSGGQRQRLAIARALLARPEILLFDEATSHLDTATERAIQESLRSVLADKTVVLVAHRLSTIREADRIYVLHEGRIVEQGSHRELLLHDGRYAALCRAQSGENLQLAHSANGKPASPCNCRRALSTVLE